MSQFDSMAHSATKEDAVAKEQMVLLMEAMLEKEIIRFRAYAWCFGMVDIFVTSDLFAEKEFVLSVYEDDWNGGPTKCVAKELAKAVAEDKIELLPLPESKRVPLSTSPIYLCRTGLLKQFEQICPKSISSTKSN